MFSSLPHQADHWQCSVVSQQHRLKELGKTNKLASSFFLSIYSFSFFFSFRGAGGEEGWGGGGGGGGRGEGLKFPKQLPYWQASEASETLSGVTQLNIYWRASVASETLTGVTQLRFRYIYLFIYLFIYLSVYGVRETSVFAHASNYVS